MIKTLFAVVVISIWVVFPNLQAQPSYPLNYFSSPIDFQIYLAANFGEIRTNHFHSGIDIKTRGSSGVPIHAAADGYVVRMSISPSGFGHALYINHPNGYTTVYGHLSRFSPELEAYITRKQYDKKRFQITVFLGKDNFPVKKGDIIAYSGNTGGSTGPHLHFEIRETRSEHPTNPLLYGLKIVDHIPPVIRSISIYPLGKDSYVEGTSHKVNFGAFKKNGSYSLKTGSAITLSGQVGIGVEAYDKLDGVPNKCGVYSIDLQVDEKIVSAFVMNEFAFSETRYINSYIDYATRLQSGRNIRKTWIDPNNRLRVFTLLNRGKVFFNDENEHQISLIVKDTYGNSSQISFQVRSVKNPERAESYKVEPYLMMMPYQQANHFKLNGFEINIPAFALYDSLKFRLLITPPTSGIFSKVYQVHDRFTPLQKYYTLRINPVNLPTELESKALMASPGKGKTFLSRGGEWKNGAVEFKTREFGKFFIAIDTVPPKIQPENFKVNQELTGYKILKFTITDDFSGIEKYAGSIDGHWALFEYDPKNDLLFYRMDVDRIEKNREHELILNVADNKGNESVFQMKFIW